MPDTAISTTTPIRVGSPVAVTVFPVAVMVAKLAVIAHPPEIVGERSSVAGIERVGTDYMLKAVDSPIELVFFVTPLIEAALEIEQLAARLIKALAVGA